MALNQSSELIKGTLSTIILRLLSQEGRMYGYELTQHVKTMSDGKILIKEGSLYPALHRLEADGHIQVETVYIGKRVRKYYSLTPKGEISAKQAVNELLEFLHIIENLITTDPNYGIA
jgi:DNA-binding PadR family transcriptional regulator